MDTNTRWSTDAELNQYLDNWLNEIQEEFEFVWAIQTLTAGTQTSSYIINTSTFTPGMLRCEAVYYNGFRLSGRLLQNLEVGNPTWRGQTGLPSTATQDTPRLIAMYPDSQNILVWPTPVDGSSNVLVFEYPCLLSFATDSAASGLPVWTQWCAKPYVCAKVYQRPGPINDPRRAQRYWAQYQRAKARVKLLWDNFLPDRYRKLVIGGHYEGNILLPPPAFDVGTTTATGT
jgi:hypothetical protein